MTIISKKTSLSKQKIEIGDAIHSLENEKSEIQSKINVLKRGFSAQIYKGAQGMKNSLKHKYNLKDADELEYDMASAMDRVVSFFCFLPHQLVDNIMDKLEAEKRAIELEHAGVVPIEVQKDVYDIAPETHEVGY